MRAINLRSILLLSCVLALGACATSGPVSQPIDEDSAQALQDQGDFRGAAAEYERLAKSNRRQRDLLLLRAAEALREEADWDAVDEVLTRVQRKHLQSTDNTRLDVLLAEIALARGDAQRALDLATVSEAELAPALRGRVAEIRARALEALGRPLDSATERLQLGRWLDASERRANDDQVLETLAKVDTAALAHHLGEIGAADPMRPWLERALRLKGVAPSRVIPRPTRQVGTLLPADQGNGQQPWAREGYSATPRVALLLPLTGALAAAGGAIRDGFFAAYFADTEQRPQVRVFDSGETPESALAAYRAAVVDGSSRVIGPLARDQVAAVQSSVELTVPVLALNHPDNGAAPPLQSQQFGLLPDDEAALAAEYAIARGLRHASILTGTEEWSERAALAFRAQFEQQGGEIIGESRVSPTEVDYSAPIAQASGSGGADLIFLAVRSGQGRLLVPQLRAHGFDRMPLLATSHIFSGVVSRALDRDLDEVEFCDSPWLFGMTTGLPSRDTLSRKLPAAANNPRLFAFGMDAYRLLPYLDWLSHNNDAYLPGASGQLTIDEFGRVRRLLTWMRFADGVPRAADGALMPETDGRIDESGALPPSNGQ